jgi:hypothetical protein
MPGASPIVGGMIGPRVRRVIFAPESFLFFEKAGAAAWRPAVVKSEVGLVGISRGNSKRTKGQKR